MNRLLLLAAMLTPLSLQASPGQVHYISQLQAEVKESPSVDSTTKFIIAIGRKVIEFERKGEWVSVGIDKSGGRDGWVHVENLSPTDPDGLKY